MTTEYLKIIATWLPIFTIGSFFISAIALFIAIRNYRRKTGLYIRGGFSTTSSSDCDDDYISSILIENLKDRAITIFCIYLQVGHNNYMVIEDFENDTPLVLKAFETYKKQYGALQFYSAHGRRVSLNELLHDKKAKKRLILSTSEGKYAIPSAIRGWSPLGLLFKNHMTLIIHPKRLIHNKKPIGNNIKYVVDFVNDKGTVNTLLIKPRDFELKISRSFQLTKESLKTKENLEQFFIEQKLIENISYQSMIVYETDTWTSNLYDFYENKIVSLESYNSFQYYVLGKFSTWFSNRKLNRENKNHKSKRRSEDNEETPSKTSDDLGESSSKSS